jgi:hypothetical protein
MAILSHGNRKLPRRIAIFNLPRLETCPWATDYCKEICYARKAERSIFYRCLPQRKRNYQLSLREDFADIMIAELSKIRKKKIRIHESGDFYSQEYLDKWIKIINHFPERTFVAYTKSMLDFSKKPDNFILLFSMDKSTPKDREEWYRNNPYKNALAFIDNEKANCPGSCKICQRCYYKETVKDIYFHKH